jgi:hypothetical protein
MPDFGTPFAGITKERKLTTTELVRAVRFVVSAEYEAFESLGSPVRVFPTIEDTTELC